MSRIGRHPSRVRRLLVDLRGAALRWLGPPYPYPRRPWNEGHTPGMWSGLEIIFHLPGPVTEIRFLDRLPEVGEVVELEGHLWRVARVDRERNGVGYDVVCEPPPTNGRLRDLTDDLLRRVRRQGATHGLR